MVATISGGTIPDRGLYTVNLADRTRLGELDEEFVHESRVGDVFQLGSSTWRIRAIEHDRVIVIPAPGAPARMPFWHGEFMARSRHLTRARRRAAARSSTPREPTTIWRRDPASLPLPTSRRSARSSSTCRQQRAAPASCPTTASSCSSTSATRRAAVRIVLHAPFGGRVNAPWGMALAQRVRERLGVDVQVQTTDDGLMLRLPDLGAAAAHRRLPRARRRPKRSGSCSRKSARRRCSARGSG